ncbi:hypothetical protein BKA67DRAFT_531907 [Truncatella angustata]|uniref:Uncharacterized protein n=1 Tax=Truncatella angustata TaxID=152316 RepID=A0A9P8UR88_9PEZI|nr:uncharacterized protein BKA67DRAFT_531907 [Truncatella angustata]KAH6656647.1 hypothetical protein BKA67DRAFT_531907 [Truncatella angustata]KAH8199270.1 hypothetical protein TruAng_006553 [Truncatella angustata]
MINISLSRRDANVLEKIKDPESDPSRAVIVEPSLPKDPNITDLSIYERVSKQEKEIVLSMQQLEMQLAGLKAVATTTDPIQEYQTCVSRLGMLITEHPRYASARNNRAQALRRLYGDTILLKASSLQALNQDATEEERANAAVAILTDLDEAVSLLTPKTMFGGMSPVAGRTLSLAHTQRAAIYHTTAKSFSAGLQDLGERKETDWSKVDFETAASRDFAFGGRYGNEVAKGLAVATNPTAKLCGQMVREAMKKEYGQAFEGL